MMDSVVRWDCTVKMESVEGLSASRVMDALLAKTAVFADVEGEPIEVQEGDGSVLLNFELSGGLPSHGDDPCGPLVRAATITRTIAEQLVGIATPLLEVRAVRL
jgi:hypothetical protein